MSLFQKSVINKYLSNQDQEELSTAYKRFKKFYSDSERIENIKQLKEENYQTRFLDDIFCKVLGYTLIPDKNYNLTTEYKNETDSKKADGAILKDGKAIGVIELKSTKTVNLESITNQAFNYKNNQSKCKYVITSNFEKLNFYIDNATEWEEFNLFALTEKDFALFYLLLNHKNLLNDVPLQIKKQSRLHEENISDKFYKDYSQFKHKIYNNLVKNNPQYDKLVLFKKSQKLLDRVLFILFAEDSGLVPPNAISKIVDQYEQLKELDEEQTLYSRFIKFFHHLNVGHKYKTYSLPAYNGGLFKEDEILDNVHIDDEILLDDMLHLSSYDFSTEVDVNILGHIFEHSLTEIEEITAELEGTLVEREKSKRKKDGIFYTPKYITKYIVDNTIGALCNEKKKELNLNEIDEQILENSKTKRGSLTAKAEKIFNNLDKYREYILSLKILDPACGSGAFLNQALDFLINEHKWIDEHKASLLKEAFTISEYEKETVENNIYGVDINEEAVEIAKLSLWLRTAKKGRKLSTLSNNIKCGNSLINDPNIAGEKAFNWNEEFKEIMSNGGFDVVIGNPPYFSLSTFNKLFQDELKLNYINGDRFSDIYCLFYELGIKLLKVNGQISYITSNQWLQSQYGKILREYFLKNIDPIELINFGGYKVFKDATVDSSIFIGKKTPCNFNLNACHIKSDFDESDDIVSYIRSRMIKISDLSNGRWQIIDKSIRKIRKKISNDKPKLKEHDVEILRGILTGFNKAFIINTKTKEDLCKNNHENLKIIKPLLRGRDIHRYKIDWNGLWLINTHNGYKGIPRIEIENYPSIKTHLDKFISEITKRADQGKTPYNLRNCTYLDLMNKEKIIYPETTVRRAEFYRDRENYFIDKTAFMIVGNNLGYYQSILASKLLQWFLEYDLRSLGKNSIQYSKIFIENTPIPKTEDTITNRFNAKSNFILNNENIIQQRKGKFVNRLIDNFELEKISPKLQSFYEYDFNQFRNELKKQKVELSLKQQDEWEDYFNEYKTEINQLQEQITKTDNEIDVMVYKLYNLTYDEVKIVDPNFFLSEEEYNQNKL